MFDTVRAFLDEHPTLLAWLVTGSAAMLVVSLLTLPVVAVLLPADFLGRLHRHPNEPLPPDAWRRRHPVLRWSLRVLKNLAGAALLIAGIAMLVLPGQGLITIALALLLLDIPGKRKLEHRLLHHPKLLGPINRVRRRFGRAELRPATREDPVSPKDKTAE